MNKKAQDFSLFSFMIIVIIIGILTTVIIPIRIVSYNEYAVEKEWGKLKYDVKESGFTWVGIGSLIRINNQVRNYEIEVSGASNDFQDVNVILNLNIRINKDKVYDFVRDYKDEETFTNYLNNKVQEKVKTILLKYSAEEMLLNRTQLRDEMYEAVRNLNELKYFEFNDLVIKNIAFSEEFNNMLERRASINQEKVIILKQKENLKLLNENFKEVSIDEYFKYRLIEKWDGKSDLIISEALIR